MELRSRVWAVETLVFNQEDEIFWGVEKTENLAELNMSRLLTPDNGTVDVPRFIKVAIETGDICQPILIPNTS